MVYVGCPFLGQLCWVPDCFLKRPKGCPPKGRGVAARDHSAHFFFTNRTAISAGLSFFPHLGVPSDHTGQSVPVGHPDHTGHSWALWSLWSLCTMSSSALSPSSSPPPPSSSSSSSSWMFALVRYYHHLAWCAPCSWWRVYHCLSTGAVMHQRLNDHFQVGWPITFEFGEDVFFQRTWMKMMVWVWFGNLRNIDEYVTVFHHWRLWSRCKELSGWHVFWSWFHVSS